MRDNTYRCAIIDHKRTKMCFHLPSLKSCRSDGDSPSGVLKFIHRSVQKLWIQVQNLRDNWSLTLHSAVRVRSSIATMATASKRGTCSPCQLCSSKIDDTRNRRNLGVRTAECATASLDRLCREVGRPRAEIVPGPVCKKCFQDLEKLTKVQSTADLLRARFFEYIRSNVTLLHSPLRPPVVEPSVLATKHKRTLSSADVSSPVLSSTPSIHPPPRKRPLLVRKTSKARKSLQFTPELS